MITTFSRNQCEVVLVKTNNLREQIKDCTPACIRLNPQGILYVADEINHQILQFDNNLNYLNAWGKKGHEVGSFWYPVSLCWDDERCLYVADKWNHRIQVFDKQGNFIRSFGHYGINPGDFNEPTGIEWRNRLLYVADKSNGRVQAFDHKGCLVHYYENNASLPGFYASKAFKNNSHYKRWLGSTSRFNSMRVQFEESGFKVGSLEYPEALVITAKGEVIVLDAINNIISQFSADLRYLTQIHYEKIKSESENLRPHVTIQSLFFENENDTLWLGGDDGGALFRIQGEQCNVYVIEGIRFGSVGILGADIFVSDGWSGMLYKLKIIPVSQ